MQEEAERGETPVPDLRNLDVYYEVGAELVQANLVYQTMQPIGRNIWKSLPPSMISRPFPSTALWTAEAARR